MAAIHNLTAMSGTARTVNDKCSMRRTINILYMWEPLVSPILQMCCVTFTCSSAALSMTICSITASFMLLFFRLLRYNIYKCHMSTVVVMLKLRAYTPLPLCNVDLYGFQSWWACYVLVTKTKPITCVYPTNFMYSSGYTCTFCD